MESGPPRGHWGCSHYYHFHCPSSTALMGLSPPPLLSLRLSLHSSHGTVPSPTSVVPTTAAATIFQGHLSLLQLTPRGLRSPDAAGRPTRAAGRARTWLGWRGDLTEAALRGGQEGAAGCSGTERGAGPGSWAWAFLGSPRPLTWAQGEGSLHPRWVPRGRARRAGVSRVLGPGGPSRESSLCSGNTRVARNHHPKTPSTSTVWRVSPARPRSSFSPVSRGSAWGGWASTGCGAHPPPGDTPLVPPWVCACPAHTCAPRSPRRAHARARTGLTARWTRWPWWFYCRCQRGESARAPSGNFRQDPGSHGACPDGQRPAELDREGGALEVGLPAAIGASGCALGQRSGWESHWGVHRRGVLQTMGQE